MNISSWVHTSCGKTGFITDMEGPAVEVYVTKPRLIGPLPFARYELCELGDYLERGQWDDVIDIALMTKDEAWFRHCVKERNRWQIAK